MNFQDIFESSFLDNVTSIRYFDMVLALVLAFLIGLFIFWIYKRTYSGVMYSASFGISLIAMTMITTLVIMAVASNVILSLGMVGALSIVRFRTPVKDPVDIVFLFWCIAAGVVLAAGLLPMAVLGSLLIGVMMLVFASRKTRESPFILMVICADQATEARVVDVIQAHVKKMLIKSKSVTPGAIEINYEVRLRDDNADFVNTLSEMEGVGNAVLVSYNGDYVG